MTLQWSFYVTDYIVLKHEIKFYNQNDFKDEGMKVIKDLGQGKHNFILKW